MASLSKLNDSSDIIENNLFHKIDNSKLKPHSRDTFSDSVGGLVITLSLTVRSYLSSHIFRSIYLFLVFKSFFSSYGHIKLVKQSMRRSP